MAGGAWEHTCWWTMRRSSKHCVKVAGVLGAEVTTMLAGPPEVQTATALLRNCSARLPIAVYSNCSTCHTVTQVVSSVRVCWW